MRNFFLFCIFILGSAAVSFSQDSSYIKIPSDTNIFCIVQLDDGLMLKGRIIAQHAEGISFRDNNLGLITVKTKNISFIEQAGTGMYFLFYMKDGSLLHGTISAQNANEIEVETKSIGKRTIPMERIKEIRKIDEKDIRKKGKYWYPNMNASRYFFGSSAIPLQEGEGYYQTVDLLVNNFNYGITNTISVSAGAVLPFGLFIMPKYGHKLTDVLHVGGGVMYAQTLLKYRKTNYKFGALYGLTTFGNTNNNLTFGLGYAFSDVNKETEIISKPVLMIDGMLRISRRFSLVAENMILPIKHCEYLAEGKVCEYNYKFANIYGVRFMKEKVTADLGLLHYPQDIFSAFPYLDFVIKF